VKNCFKQGILAALLLLSFVFSVFPYGLVLNKTESKSLAVTGDTVTFCLSIIPEKITAGAKADIIWVIDTSESMTDAISAVQNNVTDFTAELAANYVDYRQGLVSFRDIYDGIPADQDLNFGFASSDAQFLSWIGSLYAYGGGDPPESGLDALVDASSAVWRPGASRIMILVTDAPVKCWEDGNGALSMTATAAALVAEGVNVYPICIDQTSYNGNPKKLAALTGGIWLDYYATVDEWQTFFDTITANTGSYTNVTVTDTLPAGLTLIDSACGAAITGSQLSWNIASVLSSGTYSVCCFKAVVSSAFDGCVTNTAYISGDGIPLAGSDSVLICYPTPTPTFTATRTATPTRTITSTATVTETRTVTCTRTITATLTLTLTRTYTPTVTPTRTVTCTRTITPTSTITPVPLLLSLKGSFPNPFTFNSRIVYWLSRNADMEIKIFTVSGELVLQSAGIKATAGNNSFAWDGLNNSGRQVSSGVFIYELTATTELDEKQSALSKCACIR